MINVSELKDVFAQKFVKTGSFDEAFTKAVWQAFLAGSKVDNEAVIQVMQERITELDRALLDVQIELATKQINASHANRLLGDWDQDSE